MPCEVVRCEFIRHWGGSKPPLIGPVYGAASATSGRRDGVVPESMGMVVRSAWSTSAVRQNRFHRRRAQAARADVDAGTSVGTMAAVPDAGTSGLAAPERVFLPRPCSDAVVPIRADEAWCRRSRGVNRSSGLTLRMPNLPIDETIPT